MTVSSLEEEMDSDEFIRWAAFFEFEAKEQERSAPEEGKTKKARGPEDVARFFSGVQ